MTEEYPEDVEAKSDVYDPREQATKTADARAYPSIKGKRPPGPESRKSSLSHEQHIRYLELFKKCTKRFFTGFIQPPTEEELEELKEFEKLQVVVAKEQEECQTYLKQLALYNPYLYTNLPPNVIKYMKEKVENNWRRADSYARYYNQHLQLPLTAAALSVTVPPTLVLVQTLVQLGSKCRLQMPDLNPNLTAKAKRLVPMEIQKVTARFPSTRASKQLTHSGHTWDHEPASKDSNMEALVHKYQCHIATSVSVIQQLLDNHPPDFSASWDIPVVIREYSSGSASKKVVYLDKPLLPKGLSQCQKKSHYLQKAVRAYMCQPHNDRVTAAGKARASAQRGQGGNQEPGAERKDSTAMSSGGGFDRNLGGDSGGGDGDDDPFGASVSMEDLETFGSDRLFTQSSWKATEWRPETFAPTSLKNTGMRKDKEVMHEAVTDEKEVGVSSIGDQKIAHSASVAEPTGCGTKEDTESVADKRVHSDDYSKAEAAQSSCASRVSAAFQQSSETRAVVSSAALDPDASSDSEDDGLVIAEPEISEASASYDAKGSQPRSLRRSSRSSKSSIFDEVPVVPVEVPTAPVEQDPVGKLTPRRMTRSVAHKLQSPEGSTTQNPDTATARAARQGSKRKLPDQLQTLEAGDVCSGENPALSRSASSKTKALSTGQTPSDKRARQIMGEANTSALDSTETPTLGKPGQTGGMCVSHRTMESQPGRSGGEKQGVKKLTGVGAVGSTPLDSILKEMAPTGDSTSLKFQAEDPSQYHQPECTGDHVGYHLWNLSGIAVMVRSNNHAFIRDMRQQQKVVYVRAKAERQVQYGLEQVTLSECVRAWLGCYLRPNSYLLRARVNMQTQEVVHIEELQLDQILQPSLNFSPPCAFAVLQNIFSKLIQLPAGSYLLSHESGADHVQLKAGTGTKRGGFDLRCQYMGLGVMKETDKTVPWVPVDPTLVLPHHWRLGLIPATFQPPDFDSKRKQQQRHHSGPKKKNKKKKKTQN